VTAAEVREELFSMIAQSGILPTAMAKRCWIFQLSLSKFCFGYGPGRFCKASRSISEAVVDTAANYVRIERDVVGRRAAIQAAIEAADWPLELFFAVLFEMGFHRLLGVSSGVNHMAPGNVTMVCSFLMTSSLMMLGRFPVVASGMRQMF
jgi:hypothetical protein